MCCSQLREQKHPANAASTATYFSNGWEYSGSRVAPTGSFG
jgi:hypothetical protein